MFVLQSCSMHIFVFHWPKPFATGKKDPTEMDADCGGAVLLGAEASVELVLGFRIQRERKDTGYVVEGRREKACKKGCAA